MHAFNYHGKPGTCLWCGRKLRPERRSTDRPLNEEERARYPEALEAYNQELAQLQAKYEHDAIDYETKVKREESARRRFEKAVVGRGNRLFDYSRTIDTAKVSEYRETGKLGLDGYFDTNACAADFGRLAASKGVRYVLKPSGPPIRPLTETTEGFHPPHNPAYTRRMTRKEE